MSTQSKGCECAVCPGPECTCGCQNPADRPAALCQCGEGCSCGPTCTCKGCQQASSVRDDR